MSKTKKIEYFKRAKRNGERHRKTLIEVSTFTTKRGCLYIFLHYLVNNERATASLKKYALMHSFHYYSFFFKNFFPVEM